MTKLALLIAAAAAAFAAQPVPVTALAFSPDGKTLVSGAHQRLLIWDATSGKLLRPAGELEGKARAIAFRPDGRTLVVATGVAGRSGAIELVDFETGAATRIAQSADEMLAVAFSPDGKLLAFGGTEATIQIWSVDDRKTVATLKDHAGWITGVAFSPDGKLLASASADKSVGIWDAKTWKSVVTLPLTPADAVNGVAFSPEGDMLAYASEEHAIRIWRTQSASLTQRNQMAQTRPLDTGACVPLGLAWAKAPQHSRVVAACDDKTLRMMGPAGNQPITLTGHDDWVYSVAASPDGSRIASGGGDGTVRIWAAAGKLLQTLGDETRP